MADLMPTRYRNRLAGRTLASFHSHPKVRCRGIAHHIGPSQWIIRHMRINLVTPFAEKDAVKALGARWDAVKKHWYIVDAADLAPFMRWIPNMEVATENSVAAIQQQATRPASAPSQKPKAPTPSKSVNAVPHCGCSVLPWDDCVHTNNP